jgi:hypothetical protein
VRELGVQELIRVLLIVYYPEMSKQFIADMIIEMILVEIIKVSSLFMEEKQGIDIFDNFIDMEDTIQVLDIKEVEE